MSGAEKFTGKARVYDSFRPDYPEALIDNLITAHKLTPSSVIADIGSGTGILTGQLLNRKLAVIAVEPNNDMRRSAEAKFSANPLYTSVPASAEATTLEPGSADLITVAQAFHWFDPLLFRTECRRILKNDADVALIWNSRVAGDSMIQETETVCRTFCPDFHGFSGGITDSASFNHFFRNGNYTVQTYAHPLYYRYDAFIGRHLSASYAPGKNDPSWQPFIEALGKIFQKYSKDGRIAFPNVTRCYSGHV